MDVARIKTFFRQFGVVNGLRFLIAKILQKLLDPHQLPSYSQTGEDRVIDALLSHKKDGFYVDVGCHYPIAYSNTFELYARGWRGINIDANPEMIDKCKSVRPRDINICAAVSDKSVDAVFTEFDEPGVSSLSEEHVGKHRDHNRVVRQRVVNTVTLDEVLKSNDAPNVFDLLSVDVEGHDYEVIASLDLDTYRPHLIIIEMHGFNVESPSGKVYQYLISRGYRMVGYAVMNGYFLDARS
jgi:FkbM family methyltransferase